MHSRILLGLALAAQPLALGAQSLPLVLDDIACPPGGVVTLALPDFTDTRSSSSEIPPGIHHSRRARGVVASRGGVAPRPGRR